MTAAGGKSLLRGVACRPRSADLWDRYEAAKGSINEGRYYSDWFQQCCREGRDPSALARYSGDVGERVDARCVPFGDCLIWDGKLDHYGKPSMSASIDGEKQHVNVRRFVLLRAGREIPDKRRVVVSCGHQSCLNPDHLTFEDEPWTRRTSDETVYGRLQALALKLGRTPRRKDWKDAKLKPTVAMLNIRFGPWDDLIARAGLPPVTAEVGATAFRRLDVTDEEMLEDLRAFQRETGKRPTFDPFDLWPSRRASATTYKRRFGSWSTAVKKAGL